MRKLFFAAALIAGAGCSPDVIDTSYQDFKISLWGPDVIAGAESTSDPFQRTNTFEVTLRFFEDAAGKRPYGQELSSDEKGEEFADFTPVLTISKPGTVTSFSLSDAGPIVLPRLAEDQGSLYVSAEIIGRDEAKKPVARARCGVTELKLLSEAGQAQSVTCTPFYGLIGRWNRIPGPTVSPRDHAAVALPDGRVLMAGGRAGSPSNPISTVEIFEPKNARWRKLGDLGIARYGLTATVTKKGFVVFSGGKQSENDFSAAVDVFDPAGEGKMLPSKTLLNGARAEHTSALLNGETVIVSGGVKTPTSVQNVIDRVTPTSTPQSASGSALTRRNGCMAQVEENLLLVCGGGEKMCETYDGGAFRPVGALTYGNSTPKALGATKCTMLNGAVYFVGGTDTSTERPIFVWRKGDASPAVWGQALDSREGHAVATANGKVVVSGGWLVNTEQVARKTGFIFDPSKGGAPMALSGEGLEMYAPRMRHQLVSLPDGNVMAIGGTVNATDPSAEIYVVPDTLTP